MKLIFLHGPPASGKLTIARELAALTGCGVFHNHLAIDVARPFFEFGSEPFWRLVREIRLACLRAGAEHGAGTVVYTSCYAHPADLGFFEEIEGIVHGSGGTVVPVYLQAEVAELERRVTDPSRAEMGKVRSVEGLHRQLRRWSCVPVPRDGCVTIVTDGKTAAQCAREIADVLGLGG